MRWSRHRPGGWRLALVAALALCAPAAPAADESQPALAVPLHEAVYHASVRGIPVRAILRLEQQDQGVYLYRSWVEPRGLLGFINREVSETSLLKLDEQNRVIPLSYRKRDDFSDRSSEMLFDPVRGEVRVRFRGEETLLDWEPGIYDLLSLRLALAHDLARDALKDIYRVVDDRSRIEEIDVVVAGRETLSTDLGELDTVRLEYRSQRRDRLFRLWIAPDMNAAMVRLEQFEAGQLRGRLNIVEYRRL